MVSTGMLRMIWAYNLNRRCTFVCGALDGSYE